MNDSHAKIQKWFVIAILVALAVFSRFYMLDQRPVAHDESLFAVFARDISIGVGYDYDPMLHGPLLLEVQALVFSIERQLNDLFSADFSAELRGKASMRSTVAVCGLLLFLALFLFKPWLKTYGLFFASALLLTSPTLLFYSRFLRNDVPFLLATMLFIGCLGRAFGRREAAYIFPAILSAALMACIKENTVFVLFTCACFTILLLVIDQISGKPIEQIYDWYKAGLFDHPELPLRRLAVSFALTAGLAVALLIFDVLFIMPIAPNAQLENLPGKLGIVFARKNLWMTLPFLFLCTWLIMNLLIGLFEERKGKSAFWHNTKALLSKNRYAVGAGIVGSILLAQFVFTIGFSKPDLLPTIASKTVAYWWQEHASQRLEGPYHYYWVRLIIYEAPLLLILFCSAATRLYKLQIPGIAALVIWFIVTAMLFMVNAQGNQIDELLSSGWAKILHMKTVEHLILACSLIWFALWLMIYSIVKSCERFHAFAICWSIISILCYSYAGEKVPWLVVHITLPLVILASYELKQFFRWLAGKPKYLTVFSSIILFILVSFNAWNCWRSVIMNFGNPYEIIVHNHTTLAVEAKAKEIRIAEKIIRQSENAAAIHTLVKGEAIWPLIWYLRDTKGVLMDDSLNAIDGFGIILRDLELDLPTSASLEIVPFREHWELHYMTDTLFPAAAESGSMNRLFNLLDCLPCYWQYFIRRKMSTLLEETPNSQKAIEEVEYLTMPFDP